MIGLGTYEGGQERVVDVDDVVRVGGYHLIADNLHVAGQHDKRDVLLLQQLHFGLLHLCLVRVVFLNAPDIVGDSELFGYIAQVFVVGDDAGDVTGKLACLPASQEVIKAMAHLRNEDGHAWTLVAIIEAELHLIALCVEGCDVFVNLIAWNQEAVEFPFYSHEEHAVLTVNILIKVNNISLVVGNKFRHFRDDALLIGAV